MGTFYSLGRQAASMTWMAADIRTKELELLYREHRHILIDAARGVLGCRARAEDVVQDAFLKLLESVERNTIEEPLRYLFRMVRNLSIDRLRRLALEGRYSIDEEHLDELLAPQSGTEQQAIGQLQWQRLQRVLDELPERTRTVFTMSQLEGYSQREVATSLSASPTLVHFLLRDALDHCRNRLEPSAP